jgi:hypothetical protein
MDVVSHMLCVGEAGEEADAEEEEGGVFSAQLWCLARTPTAPRTSRLSRLCQGIPVIPGTGPFLGWTAEGAVVVPGAWVEATEGEDNAQGGLHLTEQVQVLDRMAQRTPWL